MCNNISQIKFGTDGWRAIIADTYTFENVKILTQAVADYLQAYNQIDNDLTNTYNSVMDSIAS